MDILVNDTRQCKNKVDRNNNDKHPHNSGILLVSQLHCSVIFMCHFIGFQGTSAEAVRDGDNDTRNDQ